MTPPMCPFCYRRSTVHLRRQRRSLVDVLRRRPVAAIVVCDGHIGKGLDWLRSWRWRNAR